MVSPAGIPQRFQLLRQIGAGGMGVVYEARDRERNLRVAIKTLQRADSKLLYFLKQEFRSLADITHRNLVGLHELVSDGQAWLLVMEFIEGLDLIRYVRGGTAEPDLPTETMLLSPTENRALGAQCAQQVRWPPLCERAQFERLRAVIAQVAAGAAALHRAGKLHRDIKPNNILIDCSGRVVLLDFGLATDSTGSVHEGVLDSSRSGTFVYMSPEQAFGLPLSEASDWYSLGVVLYEAIAGRMPFSGSRTDLQNVRASRDPPPVRQWAPAVPADLEAICAGLLHPQPEQRIGAGELMRLCHGDFTAVSAPVSTPFVGRERHLQALENAFAAVREGSTVAVYVRGVSGIGKSELVNHFLLNLERLSGVMVLRGRCYEREAVPFKAVDSLMDALGQRLGRMAVPELRQFLAPDSGALARVFPVLQPVMEIAGIALPDAMDRQELRQAAFSGLRAVLRRLGARFRLVLYIDDLHWGDADSASLLSELLRQPNAPRLLLAGSYRSEYEDSPCLRGLLAGGAGPAAESLTLDVQALSPAEAQDLALKILSETGVHPDRTELAARIAQEAGGHPYLIAELAGASPCISTAPAQASLNLDAVLWNRVVGLPERSRQLLEFVSICGRPLRQDDAYEAAGFLERDPVVLAFLRSARLARISGPGDQDVIEPYHDRVRETVVEHIASADRLPYHRRLAEVFEVSGHADEETLAVHFEAGGAADKAGHYYSLAGDRAAAGVAFERSVSLYRRALALLTPGETARCGLRPKLAEALASSGRGTEAAEAFLELARQAEGERGFEYRRKAAYHYCASGRVQEGRDTFRDVLARVGLRMPASQAGALLSAAIERLRLRWRDLHFQERAEADVPRAVLARIDAAWAAGASLATVDLFNGVKFIAQFLRLALDAGEPYRVARALGLHMGAIGALGPSGRRRSTVLLKRMEWLVHSDSRPELRAAHRLSTAIHAYMHARWAEALRQFGEAEAILSRECTGVAWELSTCRMFTLWCLHDLGEYGELASSSSRWFTVARERGDLFTMTNIGAYAEPLRQLASGRPGEARAAVASALAAWPQDRCYLQTFLATIVLGWIELYSGNTRAAWDHIRSQWWVLRRALVLRPDHNRIYARDLRIQAALAMAAQSPRPEPWIRFAAAQIARQERETLPHGPALALNGRAAMAAQRGDRGGAIECLREAVRRFDALDMQALAGFARRRLGELMGPQNGRELIAESDSFFRRVGVASPEHFARLHCNGFSRLAA